MRARSRALLLAGILAAVTALAVAQTEIKPGFNLFSPDEDVRVGQQSAAKAEQQLPILDDPKVNAWVHRIGQRLAAHAGGPKFDYQFHVVNASDINAFALPGGFVFVNRGVIDTARNEGEVAGVMAHEIAHVALRHGTHQSSKAYLAKAGLRVLGGLALLTGGLRHAAVVDAIGGLGMNALFLRYSRELESQADVRGSQILAASGYSPVDMANFFKNLERVDPSRKTSFLSDHPAPPDRIARIEKEARYLQVTDKPTENVAELKTIQAELATFGPAKTTQQIRQAEASTSKSGRTRTSDHPVTVTVPAPSTALSVYTSPSGVYRVSYPSNWKTYDGGSMAVTIAPPGGVGNIDGNSEIVYGAMVNHYQPFGNRSYGRVTLQQATLDLVDEIQRTSPYLRHTKVAISGSSSSTATAEVLRGTDPVTGIDERVSILTRQLSDDHILYIVFVTPDKDADGYQHVLDTMARSLQINPNKAH